ncbi:acetylornithine transaminase [Neisseriaceae bacterium ESL0693]|nr:acetylornithine transaminase [Neisseriaceae bacterium ESL0693]
MNHQNHITPVNMAPSDQTDASAGTRNQQWLKQYHQSHAHVFGTPLRVLDHGRGVYVWDVDGHKYLDFLAGIAVNTLGYAHPTWLQAIEKQASQIAHISNYFASVPQISLAQKMLEIAQAPAGSLVYFANSGTEANEAALKLARLYGRTLTSADKPARILALNHGFHGRTLGALSATWKPAIRTPYQPLLPAFDFIPANDMAALQQAFEPTDQTGKNQQAPVAAIILEIIQGEAGVCPLNAAYLKAVRQLCDQHQALLIIDEVQTGMGRTGIWFAFQNENLCEGITPDVVTFAKGIASGFPMGGIIIFGQQYASLFTPGIHGSTFGGNPLAAAAALATIDVITRENLLGNARERGRQLQQGIMSCGNPLFKSVRGTGLLQAIELTHPCAHAVASWALDHGLIINAVAANAIRLAPPLIIQAEDLQAGINILAAVPQDLADD